MKRNKNQRLRNWFENLKMAQKLCIIFGSILLVSLFTIYEISSTIYTRDVQNSTAMLFAQVTASYEMVFERLMNNLDAMTKAPLYFSDLQEELKNGEQLSSDSIQKLYYSLDFVKSDQSFRYVTALYESTGKLVYVSTISSASYIAKQYYERWREAAEPLLGTACVVGFPESETTYCCTVTRIIKDTHTFQDIGLMAISIPRSEFEGACATISDVAGSRVVILDSESSVIFDTQSGLDIPEEMLTISAKGSGSFAQTIESRDYIGYYSADSDGRYTILVFADKDALLAGLYARQNIMKLLLLVSTLVTVGVTILVSSSITRPLRKITRLMENVQRGDLSARFRVQYKDEIGILGNNFNLMLDKMNELMEHFVRINIDKKQAEIDALQSQINPHFMYNTLETFRMMAISKDYYELAELIARFGRMLRYNITTLNEMTTIAREIEHLENYLFIQSSRFQNSIALTCNVEAGLENFPIIKLLIQPIVENAVFHGLKMHRNSAGVVGVHAYRKGDLCIIDISDNGTGISCEKLEQLRQEIESARDGSDAQDRHSHIGLRNVNERIRLYYGADYGLLLESVENEGTMVRITLPYEKEN